MDKWNWFNYPGFYKYITDIPEYKIFVEVGVWQGHSISYLASMLKGRPGVEIYAVDLFENRENEWGNPEVAAYMPQVPEIYENNLNATGTRQMIKDLPGYSWDMANHFTDSSIDFVFIDAGHDYDSVKKDIEAWGPKVKPTGIFAGHDASAEGVSKVLVESFDTKHIFKAPGDVWYLKNGTWL